MPILILFIFLSSLPAFSQQLPLSLESNEWKHYKSADTLFNAGKYTKAIKEYEKCTKLIANFPVEQYKCAFALWMMKDSVSARTVFKKAVESGLKFVDPQTLERSPLLFELSGSKPAYIDLRKTLYYDDIAEETKEYKLLQEMRELDLHFRTADGTDQAALQRADSINRESLKLLLKTWNWPGIYQVGYRGEEAAFLIALHSDNDPDFQRECLQRMERELYKGNISISSYAKLIDRYLVNTTGNQIFGTQSFFNEATKTWEPKPLLYPAEMKHLRSLFGLGGS